MLLGKFLLRREGSLRSLLLPNSRLSVLLLKNLLRRNKAPIKIGIIKGIELLSDATLLEEAQLRETLRKSKQETHKLQASGLGKGVDFESEVPDEHAKKTKDTSEGTGLKPGVPGVSKEDSSNSDDDSWGDSKNESDDVNDEDDDNDDNGDDDNNDDNDDGGNDDGDNEDDYEENPSFTLADYEEEEQDEEYVYTQEKVKFDDEEKMFEEEDDDVANELYGDLNITQGLRDTDMTNVEQGGEDQQNALHESGFVQEEDAYLTLTIVHDKAEGPLQSSSISSDFTRKLLNLEDPSLDINSLLNTLTVPPPPPLFDQKVSAFETKVSEFNQTSQFSKAVSSIPGIVDNYLASKLKEEVNVAVRLQSNKLKKEAEAENQEFINQVDSTMKKIIKEPMKAQVSKIMPQIKDYITESFRAEVLIRSTNQTQTSYAVLVGPTFNLLKGTCKSFAELDFHFKECYKAVNDRLDWHNLEGREYPFDLREPLPLIKVQGHQVVPTNYFINNDLEYLKGPTFNLLKGTCKSFAELDFHFKECYKAVNDRLDWHNLEGREYPFDLREPLPLIKVQGHQVVPTNYFINNDLEYLKGRSSSRKYVTSIRRTKVANQNRRDLPRDNPLDSVEVRSQNWRDLPRDIPLVSVEVHRFNNTAGNPIKEILLKLNLPDHRSILTDLKVTPTKHRRMTKPYSSPKFIANCFISDFANYLVADIIPKGMTYQQKNKFFSDLKHYFQEELYLFKVCSDGMIRCCISGPETQTILDLCHHRPTCGHYGPNVMAKKVLDLGFYWPTIIKEAHTLVQLCEACQKTGNISKRDEMPLNNIQQYENFTALSSEMLDQTFDRLQKLRNKADLVTMSMDDLYNNLKVYEPEVKGMSSSSSSTQNMVFVSSSNNNTSSTNRPVNTTQIVNIAHGVSTTSTQVNAPYSINIDNLSDAIICSFFVSQPNSPQHVHENLEQNYPDDMKEIDLSRQMAMLTMRARSEQAKKGPNYALIAFLSSSSDLEKSKLMVLGYRIGLESVEERLKFYKENESIYLKDIKGLKFEIQIREITIRELRKKLKIAQKEKNGIQLNVDKFEHASKSLNKLIECQIFDNCKKVLGYEIYNAVPPPYTGNFMPSTPDLSFTGLDEFVNKHVVKNYKAKSSKEDLKVVRKKDDALLLKNECQGKKFNTTRPKAAVNVVKGNNSNAVKASACWVWKPKHKVVDHVYKRNSASITLKKFNYVDAQGIFKLVMAWVPKAN
nr:reverse transcriptase domain-containing protein [Tanacetum cinerariifolium]